MTTTSPLDLDSLTYKQLSALSARVYAAMGRAHAMELEKRDRHITEMKIARDAQIGAAALALGLAKDSVARLPVRAANGNGPPARSRPRPAPSDPRC